MSTPTPPPPPEHRDVSQGELFELEVSAWHATPWPKKGRDPARLSPEQIGSLFDGEPDRSFYSHARDYVLRLVWTCRRLMTENERLRAKLREEG